MALLLIILTLVGAVLAVSWIAWRGRNRRVVDRFDPASDAPLALEPVPMPVGPMLNIDGVFIDDDALVRDAWKFSAQSTAKKLLIFASVESFKAVLPQIPREIPIFLDSSLSDGVKGEEYAKELSEMGFRQLYLCTGYPPSQFKGMAWLKDIIGKEPPTWFFADPLS